LWRASSEAGNETQSNSKIAAMANRFIEYSFRLFLESLQSGRVFVQS
jgi:hypothetical protein